MNEFVAINIGLELAKVVVQKLKDGKAPTQVIAAAQNAANAIEAHWNDPVTKQNLEALRG